MLEAIHQTRSPALHEAEVECAEFIRSAIAQADRQTATDIKNVLAEVCASGYADRAKIWETLSLPEQQQFKELLPPPLIALLIEKVQAAQSWTETELVWDGDEDLKRQIKGYLSEAELKRVGRLYGKAQSKTALTRDFAQRIREAIGYNSPAVAGAIQTDLERAIDRGELSVADLVKVVGDLHFLDFQELVARCPKYFTELPAPSIEAATKKIS